ncbi:DNA polymerase-3 subunit beta [Ancylobacter sp. 3268]|uniref:DNA polymerase III subunit beta n=1 Tax=Ancylobacter sp. 3268 TaxID=2817752 RepID=UPI00286574C1|nr:DNA polymerase III subunit beta [Ancylobacter sp. 3268]MDR6952330.1 DNA polymerase-3 subunit beta [Ancylobacter sp. 3268]
MKITFERASLLTALSRAVRAVQRRNTIPILANVVLRAEDGRVTILASDLDIWITSRVAGAVIEEPGVITLPARTMEEIVKKLPEGAQIKFEYEPGKPNASLRAGRSRFSLGTMPVSDYPTVQASEWRSSFSLPVKPLKSAIDRIGFAISTEETRYYLNGIYLHIHRETADAAPQLRMVATDGHKLALDALPAPAGIDDRLGIIVPRKAVTELSSLVEEAGESIKLSLSDSKIMAETDQTTLVSKLIDGTYPDYQRAIPRDGGIRCKVSGAELLAATQRVGVVSGEKGHLMRFDFTAEAITLSARNSEAGEARDEIDATLEGGQITIGFNWRYLVDLLDRLGATAGEVDIEFRDPGTAGVFRIPAEPNLLAVIMPMRV